ncbi:hypothetical protein ACIHDR_49310, partial [Nocardia sp. NPDC052278]|uniref:hypothetical protein n=1 Tax=unclassified Nocardia TaxID=2637762 RepID=UPI0036855E77
PTAQAQNTGHMINHHAPERNSHGSITESVPDPEFEERRHGDDPPMNSVPLPSTTYSPRSGD